MEASVDEIGDERAIVPADCLNALAVHLVILLRPGVVQACVPVAVVVAMVGVMVVVVVVMVVVVVVVMVVVVVVVVWW